MTTIAEPGAAMRSSTGFATARKAMIDSQLRVSGVNEAFVLAAFAGVAREDFVPENARDVAYTDRAVPLGNGQFLASPLVHGRMLGEASPTARDKVLLVDGGSGYLGALVRGLVGSVEVMDPQTAVAKSRKQSDFTLLMIDGAIEQLPDSLAGRLAEGARVVTGLVRRGVTRLATGRKLGGEVTLLELTEIGIPVLPDFAAPKSWSF
jgi:protein-L-isoaspartate(D-aspartate) O-methyltransferase